MPWRCPPRNQRAEAAPDRENTNPAMMAATHLDACPRGSLDPTSGRPM